MAYNKYRSSKSRRFNRAKSRSRVNKRSDRRYFSNTADRTKKINTSACPMRGGFRL